MDTPKCKFSDSLEDFVDELSSKEQPTCNIDNPEDCEECGS